MAAPLSQPVQLTSLFENSTPYLLAYSVPLLLFSILLGFAGTFLTLDRTRTFAPRPDVVSPLPGSFTETDATTGKLKARLTSFSFRLDGGVGGLAIGYVFGLHASTFLALLIMNQTTASPLSPTSFLVVWVFSVIPSTILGGRWKLAALLFISMVGGITASLALCIITHPSLFSRIILTSIVTPLVALAVLASCLIPSLSLSNLGHATTRMATSCTGAFSATMSIAILSRSGGLSSWANIWDRLWVSNGAGWGLPKERGFDALFCALWVSGAFIDWCLRRWIGEDPDEKWDSYLAEYASSLPNACGRTGNFRPLTSWWMRLLVKLHLASPSGVSPNEMLFPSDAELSLKPSYLSVPWTINGEKPSPLPGYDEAAKDVHEYRNVGHRSPNVAILSKADLQIAVSPSAYDWEPPSPSKGAAFLRRARPQVGRGFTALQVDSDAEHDLAEALDVIRRPTCLQKTKGAKLQQRQQRVAEKGRRVPLEFQPKDGFSSSEDESSDDEDKLRTPMDSPLRAPRLRTAPMARVNSSSTSLSGTTVLPSASENGVLEEVAASDIDVEKEMARLAGLKTSFGGVAKIGKDNRTNGYTAQGMSRGAPDYSDVEEDVTTAHTNLTSRDTPGWKPGFIKRASSTLFGPNDHSRTDANDPSPPPGAVPATPSLVYALNRIAVAQAEAYGSPETDQELEGGDSLSLCHPSDGLKVHDYPPRPPREYVSIPMDEHPSILGLPVTQKVRQTLSMNGGDERGELWDAFWKDVQEKAAVPDP